ncbi:class III signal peptide-containing protein [Methanococcus maripaludis]|uniref:Class III signal peptide-containing protein n=1 Tax=Methanococcus maripaludis TaxID=39152 RepID=A0A8T3W885_METMI|nr:class III signal peptide-containing protein [Methanococcus maripaludis]MBG0769749.1 class III signal peptide-containing protein [Methanococcus maripaludis]
MFKKLYSKKGQVSMEIGILVASAVAVAAIASYFYAVNVKSSNIHSKNTIDSTSNTILNSSVNEKYNLSTI